MTPLSAVATKALLWTCGVLGAAALGLGLVVLYQSKDVELAKEQRDTAVGERDQAVRVNTENQGEIKRVLGINEGLMQAVRAQQQAAAAAGGRIRQLELERDAALAQRAAERRKLGRENPEVAQYQSGVMPLPLFCSLWPRSPACKDGDR